jgi:hypothetical protein
MAGMGQPVPQLSHVLSEVSQSDRLSSFPMKLVEVGCSAITRPAAIFLERAGSKTRVLPHRALRQLVDNDASMNTIAAKPPNDWPVDRQKDKFHNLERLASCP